MIRFDVTTPILAPAETVWEEAYKFARKGRIICETPCQVLAATELKLGYLYVLEEQADGSTSLRHVVDSAAHIRKALEAGEQLSAALDALAVQPGTRARGRIGTLLSVLGTLVAFALSVASGQTVAQKAHRMEEIKRKAEKKARQDNWSPRPAADDLGQAAS